MTAFVIVGAKPGGQPYRVDEQNELAAAVDQLGLNLYALRVDELENEVTRLRVAAPVALG